MGEMTEKELVRLMRRASHYGYFDWHDINYKIELSEKFMEKYWTWIWNNSAGLVNASEKFLDKHIDEIDWDCIVSRRKNITIEFIHKYLHKIDPYYLRHNENIKLSRKEINALKIMKKLTE